MTAIIALAFIALATGIIAYVLARAPAEEAPHLGMRGYNRQVALASGSLFVVFEPVIRKVGGWIAVLPIRNLRRRATRMLNSAGDYLGLTANEFIATIALSLVLGLGAGIAAVAAFAISPLLIVFVAALAGWMPYAAVVGESQRRRREIERELPATIELMAMCMSAGLDFPAAIRQVTRESALDDAPLVQELQRILRELGLGHSRRRTLEGFAQRIDSEAVRDFVAAVVQSESKGNPLREVLRVQARVLRTRRTIMAEESAARASVVLIGPLVMLLVATLLLIAGPLFIRTATSVGGGW